MERVAGDVESSHLNVTDLDALLVKTELEIRFIARSESFTRVELEHRKLDRYGARRDEMREIFDKSGDWGQLLAVFARLAEGAAA